jgi:hypothetical protein
MKTNNKIFSINRLYFTGIVAVAIWLLLFWDYFHIGVPSHHLLARKDLPAVSNWWGGLLLPLLTWFLLYRIRKRVGEGNGKNSLFLTISGSILYGFVAALLFGIILSIFFSAGNEEVPFYMMMGLFASALFMPSYRAECFLGFVIGMTYTFGGVLPIVIGFLLAMFCSVLYLLVRPAAIFVSTKFKSLFTN